MKVKILGYGQIGKALHTVIDKATPYCTFGIEDIKNESNLGEFDISEDKFDVVLVTIPYSDSFVKTVIKQKVYSDKIIVFSTTPIGTLDAIGDVVHIPIEGKHPNLTEYIQRWPFFMGVTKNVKVEDYEYIIQKLFNKHKFYITDANTTEAIKLLSTLNYGVNIEFMRYIKDIFKNLGKVEQGLKMWNYYTQEYNELYENEYGIKRYNLRPPKGEIGGHCVGNNAKFLEGVFPDIVKKGYKKVGEDK